MVELWVQTCERMEFSFNKICEWIWCENEYNFAFNWHFCIIICSGRVPFNEFLIYFKLICQGCFVVCFEWFPCYRCYIVVRFWLYVIFEHFRKAYPQLTSSLHCLPNQPNPKPVPARLSAFSQPLSLSSEHELI